MVLCLFLLTGSRVPLLKTPIPASYIAVEEAVCVIRERCYRDDQTPVFKSEQFRWELRYLRWLHHFFEDLHYFRKLRSLDLLQTDNAKYFIEINYRSTTKKRLRVRLKLRIFIKVGVFLSGYIPSQSVPVFSFAYPCTLLSSSNFLFSPSVLCCYFVMLVNSDTSC